MTGNEQHCHQLRTQELAVLVGDSAAVGTHEANYSGIWRLASVHEPQPLFIPRYCGFNFEFIVPKAEGHTFEPREHPTQLLLSGDGDTVVIHQATTACHQVESWLEFTPAGPAHIDWRFRYNLLDPERFASGLAGFFFASYIDAPDNKAIYVLSRDCYDAVMWMQFCTLFQGRDAAVVWENDPYDLPFGSLEHGLYSSRAPIRYHVPLFFGRFRDMVFAVFFERPEGVAICHGMGGGGFVQDRSDRNPAWDFFLYCDDAAARPQGEWRGRLIYKPFDGRDDILREYQQMMADFGHSWDIPGYGPAAANRQPRLPAAKPA